MARFVKCTAKIEDDTGDEIDHTVFINVEVVRCIAYSEQDKKNKIIGILYESGRFLHVSDECLNEILAQGDQECRGEYNE